MGRLEKGEESDLASQSVELRELKRTVVALREKLEQNHLVTEDARQRAAVAADHELSYLQETIAELRNQLELSGLEREKDLAAAQLNWETERRQLQATIQTLRDKLEECHGHQA